MSKLSSQSGGGGGGMMLNTNIFVGIGLQSVAVEFNNSAYNAYKVHIVVIVKGNWASKNKTFPDP